MILATILHWLNLVYLYLSTLKNECARHKSGSKCILGTIFVGNPVFYKTITFLKEPILLYAMKIQQYV